MLKLEFRWFLCPLCVKITFEDQESSKKVSWDHARTRATCSHHQHPSASVKLKEGKFLLRDPQDPHSTSPIWLEMAIEPFYTKPGKVEHSMWVRVLQRSWSTPYGVKALQTKLARHTISLEHSNMVEPPTLK